MSAEATLSSRRWVRHWPLLAGAVLAIAIVAQAGAAAAAAQDEPATTTYEIFLLRSDGGPAQGATVRVRGAESEMPPATADDLGRVKVEGLVPGEAAFFLATSADGREKAFMPILVIPEGTQRTTLRLYRPGVVRGELLDEMGQPVPEVEVQLSGGEWPAEAELERRSQTDETGRFEIGGLVAGAYYTLSAAEGPEQSPTHTWRSTPFRMFGWDGWYDAGILLPEGEEPAAERPDGATLACIVSSMDDEWFDLRDRRWRPAVETYDPNRNWAPAPEGAIWIWRAGRPDPAAERYGAAVEFRKLFTAPPSDKKAVGYLTVGADDYAAVRLNGQWVGQTNQFMRTVSMVVPSELIRAGENELRLTVRNIPSMRRDFYNPTGVAYRLELIEVPE